MNESVSDDKRNCVRFVKKKLRFAYYCFEINCDFYFSWKVLFLKFVLRCQITIGMRSIDELC